jgi:hypothetical protein
MRPPATAALRMPTGLDRGARQGLLRLLIKAGLTDAALVQGLIERGAYGDLSDYLAAVAEVWGQPTADRIYRDARAGSDSYMLPRVDPTAVLLAMPEPDFLTALEAGVAQVEDPFEELGLVNRLNAVCTRRGVPYRMEGSVRNPRFTWTGDVVVNEQVMAPALSVLDDPRFAKGPGVEFGAARAELRAATPQARKQAVAEACNAVESAMKVLLDERQIGRPKPENAQNLFNALSAAGAIPKEAEEIVLAASRFGNRKGRHGAGPVAHDVAASEAEAVVSSAATAVTFLATRLP